MKSYSMLVLKELILLNFPYNPKWSADSMQSLSKFQWNFSKKKEKNYTRICVKPKTLNSQSNSEKEQQSRRDHPSWFQLILQSYSDQNIMALTLKADT